jgi:NADH:ubiquinone oxidoreductase subunit E/NAD-dependent dihydropyrimidine dehydrogenase PreA subunit
MGEVKIIIDGREVSGREGLTILEMAAQIGVEIPTLCHRPELTPTGVCRICVVEIEGFPRLVAACHTPAAAGMVVHTSSPKVLASRKATLELLLTAHTGPCVLDSQADACELHGIAAKLELSPPRFSVRSPRFYPVEDDNPYVLRDLSKCILCRRCVKACEEVAKQNVFSVAYRGFASKIIVDYDAPLRKEVCRDCGVCIDYCPTSALGRPSHVVSETRRSHQEERSGETQAENGHSREALLAKLKNEQWKSGYVSESAMARLAKECNTTLSGVYGLATFYSFLSVRPLGRNVIRVCNSLPCFLKHGRELLGSIRKAIGIGPGETTEDGRFSLELTNCIGACDKAPAMLVNHDVHGNLTPDAIPGILDAYE